MNILITGEPLVGKTTLFRRLIQIPHDAFWVISERTVGPDGIRTGFKATNSTGDSGVFDRRQDVVPDQPMGNHQVDVSAVDRLFTQPILEAVSRHAPVIIIDEIGRLQCQSPSFLPAVEQALGSKATVLAVIRQGDDWTTAYTSHPDTLMLTLTNENRAELSGALEALLAGLRMFLSLSPDRQAQVLDLARGYAESGKTSSLRKLFQNTLVYLAESRFQTESVGLYTVRGLTRTHQVSQSDGNWSCDCDLWAGRGKYAGHPAECSHIQTIKIATHT